MINWKRKASILNQISRKLPKGFILFSSSTLLAKNVNLELTLLPSLAFRFSRLQLQLIWSVNKKYIYTTEQHFGQIDQFPGAWET